MGVEKKRRTNERARRKCIKKFNPFLSLLFPNCSLSTLRFLPSSVCSTRKLKYGGGGGGVGRVKVYFYPQAGEIPCNGKTQDLGLEK